MSVYVDKIFTWTGPIKSPQVRRLGRRWCHLWADTPEELHAFAERLGMKREWAQQGAWLLHYDLIPRRREMALDLGASTESLTQWYRKHVIQKRKARQAIGNAS